MHILKSQQFSDEELVEYATRLSQKNGGIKDKLLHWDFGPIMNMSYKIDTENYLFSDEKVPFHWDGAFHKEPLMLLFYCTESEGAGGETLFTNTEKIWNKLSDSEKEICKNITLTYRTEKKAHYGGEITVPLVQRHPVTNSIILRFAERVETNLNPVDLKINGVTHSEEFYQFMVSKLYNSDFLYEHSWQVGDLLVCDNFTFVHGRKSLGKNKSRSFKRIQIL